ncbi:TetR/AcrR family transcriptional regulator [Nocardia miyunensis]|uniref:TetR/AcrR family transcriptional regulator n=1 Tax=Nocardia miyunensis TaxID=282684 RepID=UPI000A0602C8|nr:TetR/AcrR family transcriptional regulator [Nocardia miyunensis]
MTETTEQAQSERPAPRSKHEKVLDAAVELFLAGGFDQTSMDAVAARAGVSKSTVYAHFGDKVKLFHAVTERGGAALDLDLDRAMLDPADDTEERLAHILLEVLKATSGAQFLAFLRIMIAESVRRPELTEAIRSLGAPHVVDLVTATLCEDANRHGYALPDAEVYAGLFIQMAVAGLQMDALLAVGGEHDPAFLEAQARWTTAVFLRALRNKEAGDLPNAPSGAGVVFSWVPRETSTPIGASPEQLP